MLATLNSKQAAVDRQDFHMRPTQRNDSNEEQAALLSVQKLVAGDTFLKPSVLDLQVYDETLVILTDHQLPRAFVEKIVAASWPGPVEVYCATDLMTGAETAH